MCDVIKVAYDFIKYESLCDDRLPDVNLLVMLRGLTGDES